MTLFDDIMTHLRRDHRRLATLAPHPLAQPSLTANDLGMDGFSPAEIGALEQVRARGPVEIAETTAEMDRLRLVKWQVEQGRISP